MRSNNNNIIVFASGKGGTGKSTVTVGVGTALAKKGNKVLIIDCDSGMRGVDIMLNVSKNIVFDLSDVVSGSCKTKDIIYKTEIDNISMIPAPFESYDELSASVFNQFIKSIEKDFDYILIDSPAGVGSGFITAATPAKRAIIVINAEPTSVSGCIKVKRKLINLGIENIRLVINRFNKKAFFTMGAYEDLDEVIDVAQTQLIGLVPDDYRLVALLQQGKGADNWSPSSLVFENIAGRLKGENIPLGYK